MSDFEVEIGSTAPGQGEAFVVVGVDTVAVRVGERVRVVTVSSAVESPLDDPAGFMPSDVLRLVPALLDAVKVCDPARSVTDSLLEWALVIESARLGDIGEAGGFLAERMGTVAARLCRGARAELGG